VRAYRLLTRATLPRRGGPPSMKEAARPPLRRRSERLGGTQRRASRRFVNALLQRSEKISCCHVADVEIRAEPTAPSDFDAYRSGTNAIPCGLTNPVTTLMMTPVSKSKVPTEVSAAV